MAEQFGDKTHEATPYRRQQAREQGQVAKSQDLASAATLLAAVGILMYWGESVVVLLGKLTQRYLSREAWIEVDGTTIGAESYGLIVEIGRAMLPILGLLFVVAVMANVGQTGFLFVPKNLALDIGRLSPWKGVQRVFSVSSAARLGFGIFKITVVACVAAWSVWGQREQVLSLSGVAISEIATYLASVTLGTCFKVGIALLILAILDFAFQRWKHEQDLRMTTQEVREEMKTLQGDPQILARRRAVQRQLVMNRLGAAVPKADVIVTNPTELAIAIQYDHQAMDAPVVVAKGAGAVAQRIRRLALENNVPVVERKDLARALYKQVDIGKPVPAAQYAAMAEVLRYVYQLKGKTLPGLEPAA